MNPDAALLTMLWWSHARYSAVRRGRLKALTQPERLCAAVIELLPLGVAAQRPLAEVASFAAEALHDMGDCIDEAKPHAVWLAEIPTNETFAELKLRVVGDNLLTRGAFIEWVFLNTDSARLAFAGGVTPMSWALTLLKALEAALPGVAEAEDHPNKEAGQARDNMESLAMNLRYLVPEEEETRAQQLLDVVWPDPNDKKVPQDALVLGGNYTLYIPDTAAPRPCDTHPHLVKTLLAEKGALAETLSTEKGEDE